MKHRILILAPIGADSANAEKVLVQMGFEAKCCQETNDLCLEIDQGCGALLITEEAITTRFHELFYPAMKRQPSWSDIPVMLVTTRGNAAAAGGEAGHLIGPYANVILIERPFRVATLISAVKSALRARRRQYEIKSLLEQRESLLASLEVRVSERTSELQEKIAELESFSYSISHDLRAPLRAVKGYAEILQANYDEQLGGDGAQYLDRIEKSVTRMDDLTRDLLMYSRVASGKVELSAIDLDALLIEVIDQYPLLQVSRHYIRLLGPIGIVLGHAPSLFQCFSNLVENALKFRRPGVEPEIRITGEVAQGRVLVHVEDNGIGIPPHHHSRIFQMFERLDNKNVPGTGIGLAVVKKAVERMGGKVSVASTGDHGTVFSVELRAAA